jgi:hypothetical protein
VPTKADCPTIDRRLAIVRRKHLITELTKMGKTDSPLLELLGNPSIIGLTFDHWLRIFANQGMSAY